MIDKNKIIDLLNDLVHKRDLEQMENQELNIWNEESDQLWQNRTNEIKDIIKELQEKQCSCKLMSLDEAISHANDVAEKSEPLCATNHKQLAEWLTELKDIKNKYAYLAADFDNYKKRVANSERYAHDKAFQDVILHFLNVYDDIERLYNKIPSDLNEDISPIISGFQMIFENFEKTLFSLGCQKIECKLGDDFDVNIMEAISTRKNNSNENYLSNQVTDIICSGWKYNDIILRHVKVIVAN